MTFRHYLGTFATAGVAWGGVLEPAGRAAEQILQLFWWMAGGGLLVWLAVMALGVHSVWTRGGVEAERRSGWLIVGGGVIVPVVVLAALLAYGLALLPRLVASAPPGSLRIAVVGERWWWRVRYEPTGRPPFELANEVRLPVGQPVDFRLSSHEVIHSFWIPSLGGKTDMIPGRETRLTLHPLRTGTFRGVCAEYCGASHAAMGFHARVLSEAEYAQWVEHESSPAATPTEPDRLAGQEIFERQGCGACHAIRGTGATGVIGPDLTHVASRTGLAAAALPNSRASLQRWIAHPQDVKPGALMPPHTDLSRAELEKLAAYLEGLR